MQNQIGPGRVVAMFIIGLFCAGLLIFTAIANLALLTRIYPDPQFVGFGILSLEGGVIVWTTVSFLTHKASPHFGIVLIGLGVDTLLSCTGFMYEIAAKTGAQLPISLPVIYVVGFAVVFNVGAGIVYKLLPTTPGNRNLIPLAPPPAPVYSPVKWEQTGNSGYYPALPPAYQNGGETDDPLAGRTLSQTGQLPAQTQTHRKATRGENSTIQEDTGAMRTGMQAGHAPGNRRQIMSGNMSGRMDFPSGPDTKAVDDQELEIIPIERLR